MENNDKENKDGNKNLKIPKGPAPNKPEDNFDWSKIIRMVFGWGAVIVAAVIVMQVFKSGEATYIDIPYDQYNALLKTKRFLPLRLLNRILMTTISKLNSERKSS